MGISQQHRKVTPLREAKSPVALFSPHPYPHPTSSLCAHHSPEFQLVSHSVVAVSEGAHPALLAGQVLAELMAVALQRTARVLGCLQLSVQPQHAGLLLQQLPPQALGRHRAPCITLHPTCPQAWLPCSGLAYPPLTCRSPTLSCSAPGLAGSGASWTRVDSKPEMTLLASRICCSSSRLAWALPRRRGETPRASSTPPSTALPLAPHPTRTHLSP